MSIERRVQLIENLYFQLEQETILFKQSSGIDCVSDCGKCCAYPGVEASPLEFLPWAFHLFLHGQAETMLSSLRESDDSICKEYRPLSIVDQGRCGNYYDRGLICRLFGVGANTDKYGSLRLATCKSIKDDKADSYAFATKAIANGLSVPVFTEYYMQLNQIDFHLGNIVLPINKALKMALEEVLQYYAYRPFPELLQKCV